MKALDLEHINKTAPYEVRCTEDDSSFFFTTESFVEYSIGFLPDDLLRSDESYELIIGNINEKKSPRDLKVKETITAIVEEFFEKNRSTILFLCSTSDGKQLMRGRLFRHWFDTYCYNNRYTMVTSTLPDEYGIDNVAALIIRNDNPNLGKVLAEFGETIEMFSHKPQD